MSKNILEVKPNNDYNVCINESVIVGRLRGGFMFDDLVYHEGAGLFHDFELAYIIADYRNKQVIIQLKSPCSSLITHELKLFGVQHFQMQFTEPWGKGMYVAATDIERKGSLQFMEMRLNSGDLVTAEFDGE